MFLLLLRGCRVEFARGWSLALSGLVFAYKFIFILEESFFRRLFRKVCFFWSSGEVLGFLFWGIVGCLYGLRISGYICSLG